MEEQTQTQTLTISDADVQRISQAVAGSCSGSASSVLSRLDGIDAQILASAESLSESVAASRVSPDVAQVVSVSGDQYALLSGSLRFSNSVSLFTLALVAVLVGMLFFREFSRGFRRA